MVNNEGFSLIEIVIALALLLMVILAFFPLFSVATKISSEKQNKIISSNLAEKSSSYILSDVTNTNFDSEEDDAPLKIGSVTFYFDNNGNLIDTQDLNSRFSNFTGEKTVTWINDGDSDEENDYKLLNIKISSPSVFTGATLQKADISTIVTGGE